MTCQAEASLCCKASVVRVDGKVKTTSREVGHND